MQAAIAVPSGTTEVERAALVESLRDADAGDVLLLEQPLAAARGAGLSVDGPRACMIVDIGAGVTEAAVLSLSGIVYARTVAVGGNDMDAAIVEHVRAAHHLLIGERTAERAKIAAGSAAPLDAPLAVQIKGRCLVRGVPRDVVLGHGEIRAALAGPVGRILLAVREVLEQAPPEPCADLVETGIVLTGGSALLRGLDRRISADCGLPVRVAEKPLASVVIGLADLFARMRGRELRRLRCAV